MEAREKAELAEQLAKQREEKLQSLIVRMSEPALPILHQLAQQRDLVRSQQECRRTEEHASVCTRRYAALHRTARHTARYVHATA